MVKVVLKKKNKLYQCEECGFFYKEKDWAKKCQEWCGIHKSCNIEITKNSVH